MRIAVLGAGVGGLAAAIRLAALGHRVTVFEAAAVPGGKCARVHADGFAFDAGPSLVTLPQVFRALFAETGAPLEDELELLRVEPVTRYRFADHSQVELSADVPRAVEALEAWSPGTGADWLAFLALGSRMWAASDAYLRSPGFWPPRRPGPDEPVPRLGDGLAVRPWSTLSQLARGLTDDPRLVMVIERFATYAGGDPRRSPAALLLAGWVEHAFGAWYPRGGIYELVEALVRRLHHLGGELRCATPVRALGRRDGAVSEVILDSGTHPVDLVVSDLDTLVLDALLDAGTPDRPTGSPTTVRGPERSLSGLALLLGLDGREPGRAHHEITFPADYQAEFDDLFLYRRPVRDPTLYVATPTVTDPASAPPGRERRFVLANAPAIGAGADWGVAAARIVDRLGVGDRVLTRRVRSPADLERETGAVAGAIYGAAPHGRLASLRRPGARMPGVAGLWRIGGSAHPGGGLPMVTLGAATVAAQIGPA